MPLGRTRSTHCFIRKLQRYDEAIGRNHAFLLSKADTHKEITDQPAFLFIFRRMKNADSQASAETPELSSVAAECRRTGEPVCVTENGRPAFVMMDMASFEAREARLSAREAALAMTSAKATQAAAANGTLLAMGVVAAG